jgi:hypothetical protein
MVVTLYPGQFRMYNRDLDMTLAELPARRLLERITVPPES